MASRHLSLRVPDDVVRRLDAVGERSGRSRSAIAKTIIEEGLRMERHPGIVFRDGPAGRRPGLAAGPDVWEVARLLQDSELRGHELVAWVAKSIDLTGGQARAVISYYAEYQDEIDAWIARNDEEAELAERAWRREQELLAR